MSELTIWQALYLAALGLACIACEGWRRSIAAADLWRWSADQHLIDRHRAEADLSTERRIVAGLMRQRDARGRYLRTS